VSKPRVPTANFDTVNTKPGWMSKSDAMNPLPWPPPGQPYRLCGMRYLTATPHRHNERQTLAWANFFARGALATVVDNKAKLTHD
jgi:hypothetical protein